MTEQERKQYDRVEMAFARLLTRAWKGTERWNGDPERKAEGAITAILEVFRERPELAVYLHAEIIGPFAHAAFTCGISEG